MSEQRTHLDEVREQFTRQADAYTQMPITRDEAGIAALASLCSPQPHERALDVACGPGFLTMALATHCQAVVGVDATDALLERARTEANRRGLRNIEFRRGDAARLDLPDASFDIVSCRAAFHHFDRPEAVLHEMVRVVRPQGRVMVADMLGSEDRAKAEVHDHIERLCDPTHVRALPASEFEKLFEAGGLEPVLSTTVPLEYDVEEWMDHGGPPQATRAEIRRLLEGCLTEDLAGLAVRGKEGRLRFSHTGAVFVRRAK